MTIFSPLTVKRFRSFRRIRRAWWSLIALGQSAGTAAALALDAGCAVQDLPYARLRERLLADGQVLAWKDK